MVTDLLALGRGRLAEADAAEKLAVAVADHVDELDDIIEAASEGWKLSRIGTVERCILRLGLHELMEANVPPKVAIDEALRLTHWFAGERAPRFVNGVLDAVAHQRGLL